MRRIVFVWASVILTMSSFCLSYASGINKTFPTSSSGFKAQSQIVGTFANSRVDTLHYAVEPNLVYLSFELQTSDTTSVTSVVLKRKGLQYESPALAGDTLISSLTHNGAGTKIVNISIDPVAGELVFYVTYAGSANKAGSTAYVLRKIFANH